MQIKSLALALLASLIMLAAPVRAQQSVTGWVMQVDLHDGMFVLCDAPHHYVKVYNGYQAAWSSGLAAFSGPEQPGLDRLWTGDRVSVTGIETPISFDRARMQAEQISVLAYLPNEEYGHATQPYGIEGTILSATPGAVTLQASDGTRQTLSLSPRLMVDGEVQSRAMLAPGDLIEAYGALHDGAPVIERINVDQIP